MPRAAERRPSGPPGLPLRMMGSVSLSLPSLSWMDSAWESPSTDGVGYHPQSPHRTWGQHGSPHTGQSKEGQ